MSKQTYMSPGRGCLTALLILLCTTSTNVALGADEIDLTDALNVKDADGYARAMQVRPFRFPEDHGPHSEFKTEWWYFTGNLADPKGRPFGYELTIFGIGMAPQPIPSSSAWRSHRLYMAHFALTDVEGMAFHNHERFSRAALGLAGADPNTLHVWIEDWTLEPETKSGFPLRLKAEEADVKIDLRLEAAKPPVLNGDRGLSQKSAEPGNASYYYSMTRLPTAGTLRIGEKQFAVSGTSWLDREWSTSALGADQVGWDWFALQLSNNTEIMFYRLRRRDGSADPLSAGTFVNADATSQNLSLQDFQIEELGSWRSPKDGSRYPAGWRLKLPKQGLELDVQPLLADQELKVSVRYWEGAVSLRGTEHGKPITGRGYVELTGYAGKP